MTKRDVERFNRLCKAVEQLKELVGKGRDAEADHFRADSILLELIDDTEVTEAFESIDKWYA